MSAQRIDPGFCQCGCGATTVLATSTDRGRGYIKGQPVPFARGHSRRWVGRPDYFVDDNGCWVWQKVLDPWGYGRMWFPTGQRTRKAHRVYWEREHGPIPEGKQVHHICGEPKCVNTAHLELVEPYEHGIRHSRDGLPTSKYVGVSWGRCGNNWVAKLAHKYIGVFPTEEEAYAAVQRARRERMVANGT